MIDVQPDGIDLVSPMPDPLYSTNIYTFNDVVQLSTIADGDVVMLSNFARGYLGCDSNDDLQISAGPLNIASYV